MDEITNKSVSERLNSVIGYYNMTPNEFSKSIGFDRADKIYNIIKGKFNPSFEILTAITNKFVDIDLNWLITGNGIMLKSKKRDIKIIESAEYKSNLPKVVTVDNSQQDNIVLIPIKAAAGYLIGHSDPEFIKDLPSFHLPNLRNGTFRMFQVKGHSMYPTIQDSSYVVGEWVENWIKEIKDNIVYIVVTHEGILIKRVINIINKSLLEE